MGSKAKDTGPVVSTSAPLVAVSEPPRVPEVVIPPAAVAAPMDAKSEAASMPEEDTASASRSKQITQAEVLSAEILTDVVLYCDLPEELRERKVERGGLKKMSKQQRFNRPSIYPAPYSRGSNSARYLNSNDPVDHSPYDEQAFFWIDFASASEVQRFQSVEVEVKDSTGRLGSKKEVLSTWIQVIGAGYDFPTPWPGELFIAKHLQSSSLSLKFTLPPDARLLDLLDSNSPNRAPGYGSFAIREHWDHQLPRRHDGQVYLTCAEITACNVSCKIPFPLTAALATSVVAVQPALGDSYITYSKEIVPIREGQFGVRLPKRAPTQEDALQRVPISYLGKRGANVISTADGNGALENRALVGDNHVDRLLADMPCSYLQDPWVSRGMRLDFEKLRRDIDALVPAWDSRKQLIEIKDIKDPSQFKDFTVIQSLVLSHWCYLSGKTILFLQDSAASEYITAARTAAAEKEGKQFAKPEHASITTPISRDKDNSSSYSLYVLRSALIALVNQFERLVWQSNFLVNFDPLRLVLGVPEALQTKAKERIEAVRRQRDDVDANPFIGGGSITVQLVYLHNSGGDIGPMLHLHGSRFNIPRNLYSHGLIHSFEPNVSRKLPDSHGLYVPEMPSSANLLSWSLFDLDEAEQDDEKRSSALKTLNQTVLQLMEPISNVFSTPIFGHHMKIYGKKPKKVTTAATSGRY